MKKIVLICTLLALLIQTSFAQLTGNWRQVGPVNFPVNASGQINGITRTPQFQFHPTDPLKMYAVTATGGLFISNDGAETWNATGTDMMFRTNTASICIDYTNDQILYLGTGDANYYHRHNGIYKSTNGGATWFSSNAGIGNRLAVDILMSPLDHNVLIAATDDGLWKSTDAGATWTVKKAGGNFTEMVFKPVAGTSTIYAVSHTEFWRSTNMGETWTKITLPGSGQLNGGRVAVSKADTSLVVVTFVGNPDNATSTPVLKSTDAGLTFTAVKPANNFNLNGYESNGTSGQRNYNYGLGIDPSDTNIMYICGHRVWKSTNGGVTWTSNFPWHQAIHTDMHQITVSPYDGTKLFCSNDGGIWLSTNGGTSWTPKSNGLAALEIVHAAQSPINKNWMDVGTQDNGELHLSPTGWFTNGGGDFYYNITFDYVTPSTIYHLGTNYKRKSLNGSTVQFFGLPFVPLDGNGNDVVLEFTPLSTNTAFCSGVDVYRSVNATGFNPAWTKISNFNKQIKAMASSRADINLLFVVTNDGKIHRTENALAATPTWETFTLPAATNNRASIAPVKSNSNVVYVTCNSKVFRSGNKGLTWTEVTANVPNVNIIKIIHDEYSTDESVYVGSAIGIYYKNNTMLNWQNHSQNLPTIANITDFMIFNDGTSNSELRVSYYGKGVWGGDLFNSTPGLKNAETVAGSVNGLDYNYFEGTWNSLPDFAQIVALKSGNLSGISLSPKNAVSQYGIAYTGYINVPADGQYSFYTSSDDGSKLYIGNTLVVSNDGLKPGAVEQSGMIGLKAGLHSFTLHYFQNGGTDTLSLSYELAGVLAKQVVPISAFFRVNSSECANNGFIYREQWNNIAGEMVTQIPLSNTPSSTGYITLLEGPTGVADNYGSRMTGLICAPYTGNYTFWVSGDDNCELYLSTTAGSANKVKIAQVFNATDQRDWNARESQKSAPIALVAGQQYYIEVLQKEGGGGDHVAVGWQLPNGTMERPIPGKRISPVTVNGPLVGISYPTANSFFIPGSAITIAASATAGPGRTITKVEFLSNNIVLGEATSAPYAMTWNNVPAGRYTLTARLYDNTGAITTSAGSLIDATIATFYQHCNYDKSGYYINLGVGNYTQAQIVALGMQNNDISSVVNVAPGYKIVLFQNDNFTSDSLVLTTTDVCLYNSNPTFNDAVSSLKISKVNLNPVVAITAPVENALYNQGAAITINATASDEDGTISKVEFYNGATLIGSDESVPYSFNYTNVPAGTHSLRAKAIDNQAGSTTKAVTVVVNAAPVVAISYPSNNAQFINPGSVTINATASDVDGTIANVIFYNGTQQIGQDADTPYSFTWNGVGAGNYTITAKAIDNRGMEVTSTAVTISVVNVVGQNVALNKTVTASSDQAGAPNIVDGNIGSRWNSVQADPQWIYVDLGARYTIDAIRIVWEGAYAKDYVINITDDIATWGTPVRTVTNNVVLTNDFINVATAGRYVRMYGSSRGTPYGYSIFELQVFGTLVGNVSPTVSITAPTNNSTFEAPASVTIEANAADADGTVSNVVFYNGSVELGQDAVPPYTFNWTNVAAGTYAITAKAIDNNGAETTSSIVNVTVNAATSNSNLALNKPAFASSYLGESDAAEAVDGIAGTRWESVHADPQWWYVDLGATYNVNRVNIVWEGAYGRDYVIEISNDSTNWGAPAKTIVDNTQLLNDHTDISGTGRYVRIYGTERGTPWGFSFFELEIYGTPAGNNQIPAVSITTPANNSSAEAPASFTISANAADTDGTISNVIFYAGTQQIGEDATSPYSITWSNVAAGTYAITAKAVDNNNAATTSSAVNVTVTSPISSNLALNKPTYASSVEGGNNAAGAVDGTNATRWESLHADPQWWYVDLGASYNVNRVNILWEGAYGRDYVIEISNDNTNWGTPVKTIVDNTQTANDHTDIVGTGRYVRIYGTERGTPWGYSILELEVFGTPAGNNQAPTVSVTSPANNSSYTGPASITIDAVAADSDGTVTNVIFYAGTQQIGQDGTSPYSITWTNVAAGNYAITAKAIDNDGAATTSSIVNVTVTNPAGANLALNRPAFASSELGINDAADAVDGDVIITRWESAHADSQWIYVDLGSTYAINRVKIVWETAKSEDYVIQISNDNTNWGTPVKSIVGNTTNTNDHTDISGAGRYVRIFGSKRGTPWGHSIFELEVYGTLVPAMATKVNSGSENGLNVSNYPNPAEESTSITFNVKESSLVTISIYNDRGEKLEELVNGHKEAGHHSIDWNIANSIPSGMYYCTVQVGKEIKTLRIQRVVRPKN